MTVSQYLVFCMRHKVDPADLRNLKQRPDLKPIRDEVIARMVADNMLVREVAALMGVPEKTASQAMRALKEQARGVDGQNRLATVEDDGTVRLRLIKDPQPHRIYERRRDDCAALYACEWEWVQYRGSEQAACPVGCVSFVSREAS